MDANGTTTIQNSEEQKDWPNTENNQQLARNRKRNAKMRQCSQTGLFTETKKVFFRPRLVVREKHVEQAENTRRMRNFAVICNSAMHFIYKLPHGLNVGYFSSAASLSLIGGDFQSSCHIQFAFCPFTLIGSTIFHRSPDFCPNIIHDCICIFQNLFDHCFLLQLLWFPDGFHIIYDIQDFGL